MSEEVTPVENVEPIVEPKPVSSEAYEQTKNDMHKFKRMASDAETKQLEAEVKLKAIETSNQESQGKYKELWESTTEELNSVRDKHSKVLNSVIDDKKLTAVREFALKHNIRQEALDDLDMVDMSGVVVETTDQGRYSVHGADHFVEKLKTLKPHWFVDGKAPIINNGTGTFDGEEKTYSPTEMLDLQKKDPALYREVMGKKQNLIRRN